MLLVILLIQITKAKMPTWYYRQTVSTELPEMILKWKDDYHRQLSDKLNDLKMSAKAY